jgi:hypothetical protein
MRAISTEKSISDGNLELQKLFEFIRENAPESKSYDIEKQIFSSVLKVGFYAMQYFFAEKGTGDVGPTLKLDNGKILEKESCLRGRDYYSIFGKFKVPRTCYRADGFWGVMPLDFQVDLPNRCYSYFLQEIQDIFSIRDSFGEASLSLEKLLGLKISPSRFEVISQDTSTSYDEFYKNKEKPPAESEGALQVVSFDGKGVPVIKREAAKLKARLGKGEKRQKKKEAFVGVSYTVDGKNRTPEEVANNLIYPEETRKANNENGLNSSPVKARNIRRLASLERTKKEVFDEILSDAKARDPEQEKQWVVLMDGALFLWSMLATVFNGIKYVGILDIIHVTEYIWKAGNALYGEKKPKTEKWVYNTLLKILKGGVGEIIAELNLNLTKSGLKKSQVDTLKVVICYFENHREWMKYDEYLSSGYPIGTGVVESSCGHTVKNRMEGTGRRWSINGAEATLLLRSVYTSDDWDDYWIAHMKKERKLLNQRSFDGLGYPDDYSFGNWQCEEMTGT